MVVPSTVTGALGVVTKVPPMKISMSINYSGGFKEAAQRVVAVEAEAREVLARGLDGEVAADRAHLVHRRARGVEGAEVLVEVAVREVRPAAELALVVVVSAAREQLEQRALARAVRPDQAVKLAFPLVVCVLPSFVALTIVPILIGAIGSLSVGPLP